MNYYIDAFKNYANFNGRARRKEYWMFTLFNFLAVLVLSIVDGIFTALIGFGFLSSIYSLAVIVPSIAIAVRRLHDIGKSGWWYLIGLVPLVGGIILLVFACTDSQPGQNQYGPNPKAM